MIDNSSIAITNTQAQLQQDKTVEISSTNIMSTHTGEFNNLVENNGTGTAKENPSEILPSVNSGINAGEDGNHNPNIMAKPAS